MILTKWSPSNLKISAIIHVQITDRCFYFLQVANLIIHRRWFFPACGEEQIAAHDSPCWADLKSLTDFCNAIKELRAIFWYKGHYWDRIGQKARFMRSYNTLLFFLSGAACISADKYDHQSFSIEIENTLSIGIWFFQLTFELCCWVQLATHVGSISSRILFLFEIISFMI